MKVEQWRIGNGWRTGIFIFPQPVWECLALGGLAVASFFFISHFICQAALVQGTSMSPTLHNADRCLVDHWTYDFRSPRRGDIVVLKDPTDGTFAVKRIIGTPGDTLQFENGHVFINGRELAEPYLPPGTLTFLPRKDPPVIRCGKDHYFVLGDNRGNSFDSRIYGPVPRRNIRGIVLQ